jgi:ribosomal protein L40E
MKVAQINCPACGSPVASTPQPYQQFNCAACGSALMLTDFADNGLFLCKQCNTVNDPSSRFCSKCQAELQTGCPYCYTLNRWDALRCTHCGIDLQRAWLRQRSWLQQKQDHDQRKQEALKQALEKDRQLEIHRLLLQLDDPQNHPLAIYCLEQAGQDAVPGLLGALNSADPDTRYAAAHTLGLIGDPAAIDGLIAALRDPEAEVRFWAADALAQLKAAQAVPALAGLKSDDSKIVRQKAALALELIGTPEAQQVLRHW